MRFIVSNAPRGTDKLSNRTSQEFSSNRNSTSSTLTVIQWIILIFFCFQFLLFSFLYGYYDFFQGSSLTDFKNDFIFSKTWKHSSKQLLHFPLTSSTDKSSILKYDTTTQSIAQSTVKQNRTYPFYSVNIKSTNEWDLIPPSSKPLLQDFLDVLVEVDFPDLSYRSSEEVRARFPTLFKQLPKLGFHDDYRNPCWYRISEEAESDTESNKQLICLPYAYILGQPKSGTSDLFERLKVHPSIRMPIRKEVRWFTRGEFVRAALPHEGEEDESEADYHGRERLLGKGSTIYSFTRAFHPLAKELASHADLTRKQLITIDGGPHTLWWPTQQPDGKFLPQDIPPSQLIREIQPQAKFIITITDPVKRFYSDYYFLGDDLRPVFRPGNRGGSHGVNPNQDKSPQQLHERVIDQIDLFNICIQDYMKLLIPQAREQKLTFAKVPTWIDEASGQQYTVDLPREYQNYFPLWFRSAQMCAHDRFSFGKGGWGRLSISLYILFIEKWYEHFSPQQFHIVRLEDYHINPEQYLTKIFQFLEVPVPTSSEKQVWERLLVDQQFNSHRNVRQPLLIETEQLLREFYRPYNQLLAIFLKNPAFLWELSDDASKGLVKSLREQLIDELERPERQARLEKERKQRKGVNPRFIPQVNQHSPKRPLEEGANEDPVAELRIPGSDDHHHPGLRNQLRGSAKAAALLQPDPNQRLLLSPQRFLIGDLPQPPPLNHSIDPFIGSDTNPSATTYDNSVFQDMDLTDPILAAKCLCRAAFSLNLHHIKYLLYVVGIPPDIIYHADGKRNAFHCLATLWSMAEAHSRSHVFAELKGKTTWLTKHLQPALEVKMASVLSRDIITHLEQEMIAIAKWLHRAGVPLTTRDSGGFSPLHHMAAGGEIGVLRYLLSVDKTIDINLLDHSRRTPLHYAAASGNGEMIQLLLQYGGNLQLKDRNQVTPYDIISSPGPVSPEDALKYANIQQRAARKIPRKPHPEYFPNDTVYGWIGGSGGWGTERLPGFEKEDIELTCERIDQYLSNEITADQLFHQYLAQNRPVLIRGLLNDWPVIQQYQQSSLLASHGSLRVQVSDIPYAQKFGGSEMVEMTLSEYIEEVRQHRIIGGSHPWYVFRGHPIPRISEGKDSLVKETECPIPSLIKDTFLQASPLPPPEGKTREMFVNAQWALGGEGTGAPIHFHNTAWAALVYGAKKWMIYSPHDMMMSNKQIYDFYETDRLMFAKRGITPITCTQTAGDVMIIPESYGHGILNIQESIAIATEFKHSLWRISPPPSIIREVSSFDNREGKRSRRPPHHPPPPHHHP